MCVFRAMPKRWDENDDIKKIRSENIHRGGEVVQEIYDDGFFNCLRFVVWELKRPRLAHDFCKLVQRGTDFGINVRVHKIIFSMNHMPKSSNSYFFPIWWHYFLSHYLNVAK
jgi:hypothetical protein